MPTIARPTLLKDPGYLFWAPVGTSVPTNTVSGGVFTDAWAAPWVSPGATDDGSKLSYQLKLEAISVAEFFDPIEWAPTERSGSFAFALASYTLTNLAKAFNGSTPTIVSGTGATTLSQLDPPDATDIVRAMLGWESLDGTMRIVCFQTINGGTIESSFKRAPDKAMIPCEFNFETPTSGPPFSLYAAGTDRG